MPSTTAPCSCGCPGDPVPPEFFEAAANPSWVVAAHNDAFETAIEQHVLHPRYGWPLIPLERHRCTMAMCLALGLPAKLSAAADALELANRKDAAGERLMHQMSKPRQARARTKIRPAYILVRRSTIGCSGSTTIAGKTSRSSASCMTGCRPLSAAEQALWVLSSRINERGFHVDRQFAEAARRIAQAAAPEIDAELAELTGGAVTGINQVARLLQWLQEQGCTAQKLDRKAIEKLLERGRAAAAGAARAGAPARRRPGCRQEDRRAACPRR